MKSNNNKGCETTNEIMEAIRANENKKVKWRCELKNKLIIFTYYLKLFFTSIISLSYFIKYT